MRHAICGECGRSYLHERDRSRLCPGCVRANSLANQRAYRERTESSLGERVGHCTRKEVARVFGMTLREVEFIERRALTQIRKHPKLQKAWGMFKEHGAPTPNHPPVGAMMLAFQLRVAEWWRLHDRMVRAGLIAEAAECRAEIATFQQHIEVTLEKLLRQKI